MQQPTIESSPITIESMLEHNVHFGHLKRYRNPQMDPYIHSIRNKVCVIDLERTLPLFNQALNVVADIAKKGGTVLFVGTKRAALVPVAHYAKLCGMPYINYRWLGGMLTNYKTVKNSLNRLTQLRELTVSESFMKSSKKDQAGVNRELAKLQRALGGIENMKGLPDVLVVIDVNSEKIALAEANKLKIPVIGVVDTNSSLAGVDYLIPGNDDGTNAIKFYLENFAAKIIKVQKENSEQLRGQQAAVNASTPKVEKKTFNAGAPRKEAEKVATKTSTTPVATNKIAAPVVKKVTIKAPVAENKDDKKELKAKKEPATSKSKTVKKTVVANKKESSDE